MAYHSPSVREKKQEAGLEGQREYVGKPQDANSKRLGPGWEVHRTMGLTMVSGSRAYQLRLTLEFGGSESEVSE